MWVGVVGVTVELNQRWFELHRRRLSTMAMVVCVFGILGSFFFFTKMAIAMFCASWFLFGVLGIEIRLISL